MNNFIYVCLCLFIQNCKRQYNTCIYILQKNTTVQIGIEIFLSVKLYYLSSADSL